MEIINLDYKSPKVGNKLSINQFLVNLINLRGRQFILAISGFCRRLIANQIEEIKCIN